MVDPAPTIVCASSTSRPTDLSKGGRSESRRVSKMLGRPPRFSLDLSLPDLMAWICFAHSRCHLYDTAKSGNALSTNQIGKESMSGKSHGNCLSMWLLPRIDTQSSWYSGAKSGLLRRLYDFGKQYSVTISPAIAV